MQSGFCGRLARLKRLQPSHHWRNLLQDRRSPLCYRKRVIVMMRRSCTAVYSALSADLTLFLFFDIAPALHRPRSASPAHDGPRTAHWVTNTASMATSAAPDDSPSFFAVDTQPSSVPNGLAFQGDIDFKALIGTRVDAPVASTSRLERSLVQTKLPFIIDSAPAAIPPSLAFEKPSQTPKEPLRQTNGHTSVPATPVAGPSKEKRAKKTPAKPISPPDVADPEEIKVLKALENDHDDQGAPVRSPHST